MKRQEQADYFYCQNMNKYVYIYIYNEICLLLSMLTVFQLRKWINVFKVIKLFGKTYGFSNLLG